MSITKIPVENPDSILERASQAEGVVARIAHVNQVVNQVNSAYGYDEINLAFTTIAASNVPGIVGVGGNAPTGSTLPTCSGDRTAYRFNDLSYGCLSPTFLAYIKNITVAITSTGIYTFTFATAPALGYDIMLSPPSALNGARISVVKTSSTVFTITTTNTSGVATDGLLLGMNMAIKIYTI